MRRLPASRPLMLSAALVVACLSVWLALREVRRGGLTVDAGSVNRSNEGDARREIFFYVLDEDLIKLATERGAPASPARERVFREHPRLDALAGLMNARRREAYSLGPDVFMLAEQARPLWEPHVRASAEADAQGRSVFSNLAPRVYWLVAEARTADKSVEAFWNLQIVVGRGETTIKLDENNALYFRRPTQNAP